ncbi:MAG: hypothetical protein RID18_00100 [Cytophagales bacterium]
MNKQQVIHWLLKGDVSIQYQVNRDLLGEVRNDLQHRIALEGWGQMLLSKRHSNGHWGQSFYQPKWVSSHYTLLDLRNLNLSPENEQVKESINLIVNTGKSEDGGIRLGPSTSQHSDVCVNGMFLNYASYFKTKENKLHSLIDMILSEIMPDGGFNCRTTRSGANHSSLHTTISVLEGLFEFQKTGCTYRYKDIQKAIESGQQFVLLHRLFLSDRTGQIIRPEFLKMPYPSRWKYNILRALDYFQYANCNYDARMDESLHLLLHKKNSNGTWNLQAAHPGEVHFNMEKTGEPSRWNTLRSLRVLNHFKSGDHST